MKRSLFVGALGAAALMVVLVTPALAHGDHDARPLAREFKAGPYSISVWQVYPDVGAAMAPHLIVLFDGVAAAPPAAIVTIAANSTPMEVRPSTTSSNGWETTAGVAQGDVVTVTISDGNQVWDLDPVVVPAAATSMLPMQELIWACIALTAGAAWWAAGRTARAWRRPVARPI